MGPVGQWCNVSPDYLSELRGVGKPGGERLWNDDPGCQRPPKHEQAASIERNRAKTCKKTRRRSRFVHVVEFVAIADPKYMKPPTPPPIVEGKRR